MVHYFFFVTQHFTHILSNKFKHHRVHTNQGLEILEFRHAALNFDMARSKD